MSSTLPTLDYFKSNHIHNSVTLFMPRYAYSIHRTTVEKLNFFEEKNDL